MRVILPKLMFFMLRAELFGSPEKTGKSVPAESPAAGPERENRKKKARPDVPFVPSPREVILGMLDLAQVRKDDILYDLGCGDGRIVILAARRKEPARCVGIDIDKRRITACRENVKKLQLEERVVIRHDDLFAADISEASVVTLYLLTSVNLRLRRRLLTELKPGARVVSHDFDMGDWKPDRVSYVGGTMHKIFCWIVPANVSGRWHCTIAGERYLLTIGQKYQQASGELVSPSRAAPLQGMKLEGGRLAFQAEIETEGKRVLAEFNACADGDSLAGAIEWKDGTREIRLYWEARREEESHARIDDDEGIQVAGLLH